MTRYEFFLSWKLQLISNMYLKYMLLGRHKLIFPRLWKVWSTIYRGACRLFDNLFISLTEPSAQMSFLYQNLSRSVLSHCCIWYSIVHSVKNKRKRHLSKNMEFKTQKHKRKLYLKRDLKLNCFPSKRCCSIGFASYSYNYTNLNSIF